MRKLFSGFNPIEIIVDIFVILAIFAALVASFMIIIQTLNRGGGVVEIGYKLLGFS